MGDPTGIGPEVTLAALLRPGARLGLTPILVGDPAVYEVAAAQLGLRARFAEWAPPAPLPRGTLPVRAVARLPMSARRPGRPSVPGGRAAHAAIVEAVRLVRGGFADALTTAPIDKANLVAAGLAATGHTELLAKLCGGVPVRMMMVGSRLRVVLRHHPSGPLGRSRRRDPAAGARNAGHHRLVPCACSSVSPCPRLGVAGLNPHAGEQGVFGNEEQRDRPGNQAAAAAPRRATVCRRQPVHSR
jgi:4-hydroxythreonine-4-phosphate dehydrogenase